MSEVKIDAGKQLKVKIAAFFKNPRFYISLIIIAAVGATALYNISKPARYEQNIYNKLSAAGMMMYEMVKGYGVVCQANGYELQYFPQKFQVRYKSEIEQINAVMQKYGTTLDALFKNFDASEQLQKELVENVSDELNYIRKQIILMFVHEQTEKEQAEWNDQFYEYLPMRALCKNMDENYEDYFKAYDGSKLLEMKKLLNGL